MLSQELSAHVLLVNILKCILFVLLLHFAQLRLHKAGGWISLNGVDVNGVMAEGGRLSRLGEVGSIL